VDLEVGPAVGFWGEGVGGRMSRILRVYHGSFIRMCVQKLPESRMARASDEATTASLHALDHCTPSPLKLSTKSACFIPKSREARVWLSLSN